MVADDDAIGDRERFEKWATRIVTDEITRPCHDNTKVAQTEQFYRRLIAAVADALQSAADHST